MTNVNSLRLETGTIVPLSRSAFSPPMLRADGPAASARLAVYGMFLKAAAKKLDRPTRAVYFFSLPVGKITLNYRRWPSDFLSFSTQ